MKGKTILLILEEIPLNKMPVISMLMSYLSELEGDPLKMSTVQYQIQMLISSVQDTYSKEIPLGIILVVHSMLEDL